MNEKINTKDNAGKDQTLKAFVEANVNALVEISRQNPGMFTQGEIDSDPKQHLKNCYQGTIDYCKSQLESIEGDVDKE